MSSRNTHILAIASLCLALSLVEASPAAINPSWLPAEQAVASTHRCFANPLHCISERFIHGSPRQAPSSMSANKVIYEQPSDFEDTQSDELVKREFEGGDFALGANYPTDHIIQPPRLGSIPRHHMAHSLSGSDAESLKSLSASAGKRASWLARNPHLRNALGVGILGGTGLYAYIASRHLGHLSVVPDSWRANFKEWVMTSPDKHRDPVVVELTKEELENKKQRRDLHFEDGKEDDKSEELAARALFKPAAWAVLGAGAGAYAMNAYNEHYSDYIKPAFGGDPVKARRGDTSQTLADAQKARGEGEDAFKKRSPGKDDIGGAVLNVGTPSVGYSIEKHHDGEESKALSEDHDFTASKRQETDSKGRQVKYNVLSTPDGEGRLTVFSNIDGSPSYVLWQRPALGNHGTNSEPRNYTGPLSEEARQKMKESGKVNVKHSSNSSSQVKGPWSLIFLCSLATTILLLAGSTSAEDVITNGDESTEVQPDKRATSPSQYTQQGLTALFPHIHGTAATSGAYWQDKENPYVKQEYAAVGGKNSGMLLSKHLEAASRNVPQLPIVDPSVTRAFEQVGEHLSRADEQDGQGDIPHAYTGRRLKMHFLEAKKTASSPTGSLAPLASAVRKPYRGLGQEGRKPDTKADHALPPSEAKGISNSKRPIWKEALSKTAALADSLPGQIGRLLKDKTHSDQHEYDSKSGHDNRVEVHLDREGLNAPPSPIGNHHKPDARGQEHPDRSARNTPPAPQSNVSNKGGRLGPVPDARRQRDPDRSGRITPPAPRKNQGKNNPNNRGNKGRKPGPTPDARGQEHPDRSASNTPPAPQRNVGNKGGRPGPVPGARGQEHLDRSERNTPPGPHQSPPVSPANSPPPPQSDKGNVGGAKEERAGPVTDAREQKSNDRGGGLKPPAPQRDNKHNGGKKEGRPSPQPDARGQEYPDRVSNTPPAPEMNTGENGGNKGRRPPLTRHLFETRRRLFLGRGSGRPTAPQNDDRVPEPFSDDEKTYGKDRSLLPGERLRRRGLATANAEVTPKALAASSKGVGRASLVAGSALGLGLTGLMIANMASSIDLPSGDSHSKRSIESIVAAPIAPKQSHFCNKGQSGNSKRRAWQSSFGSGEFLPAMILLVTLTVLSVIATRQVNAYLSAHRHYHMVSDHEDKSMPSQAGLHARQLLFLAPVMATLAALAFGAFMAAQKALRPPFSCPSTHPAPTRFGPVAPEQTSMTMTTIDVIFEPRISPPKGKTEALVVGAASGLAAGAGALATGLLLVDGDTLMPSSDALMKRSIVKPDAASASSDDVSPSLALQKREPGAGPWLVGGLGAVGGATATSAFLNWDAQQKATGYGRGVVPEPFRKRQVVRVRSI